MKTEDLKKADNLDFVHSPLRYPGNQIYALDTLLSLIPVHRYYIEPFCGGASTFFGKSKAECNWLNDVDRELIETYIAMRDQPEKFVVTLTGEEVSEKRYNHFKTGFTPKKSRSCSKARTKKI
jgi:DNA adenine methylase